MARVGKVQTRLEEFGDIKFPMAGMFNEISRDFNRHFHQVLCGGHCESKIPN